MSKAKILVLLGIVLLGILFRLYRFDNPIADWHSWRQVDTSSVSREYVKNGINLLYPKYHDLSNVPSKIENPNGYRFVEFPIFNLFQVSFYKLIHYFSLEQWGRIVTIIASTVSSFLIFLILKKTISENAGLIALFFFSILPFSAYYGRVILPDPLSVAFLLGSTYLILIWFTLDVKTRSKPLILLILSSALFSLSVLVKPFSIFFILPILYLILKKNNFNFVKNKYLYVFIPIALIPFILWRLWMMQFPEGIPSSEWLLNDGNIRFSGAFFYWIFAERIGKLILGYWGVFILVLGFVVKIKNYGVFHHLFLASALIYLVIVAKGNVQHDYYQIFLLPTVCIFLGIGGDYLLNNFRNINNKYIGLIVFAACSVFSFIFSWYHVRDYYNINNPSVVSAGKAVKEIVPEKSLIIANYNGDTTFLYQTERRGWASYQYDLERMKNIGAEYLVVVNPEESDFDYASNYHIELESKDYAIFNLNLLK